MEGYHATVAVGLHVHTKRRKAKKFRQAGFDYEEKNGLFMGQVSAWLSSLPPSSLVILIDEYDAPLTASLDDLELFDRIRSAMSAFFSGSEIQ